MSPKGRDKKKEDLDPESMPHGNIPRIKPYMYGKKQENLNKMVTGKFKVEATKNGQYMFNLKASNGEIILTSEMYKTKKGLRNGIKSVKTNAKVNAHYKTMTAKNGEPYFVLRAGNNQVIGKSEMYSSPKALENGIDSVKKNAPHAPIEGLTKS